VNEVKIIWKDNFGRDLYSEKVVAENVDKHVGQELVKLHNEKHWDGNSDSYLALVENDYELYDGYADLL
jgi:hypothetical protein